MSDIIVDDSNVSPTADMDLLVENQPNPEDDYREAVGKEPIEQNPDPDKVVEAELSMDPAAATENLSPEDKAKSVENHKYRLSVGISDYHKDLVAIKVAGKKFEFNDAFQSFESFERSPYGSYAFESINTTFNEVLKPATMKDFENYQTSYESLLNKHLNKFVNKVMNSKLGTKASYTVNDADVYGTVSLNVRFKKADGSKLPLGAIYACEWYNGKPALTPIVPLMKIDERSEEKFYGYVKNKDFKDKDGNMLYPKDFDDLMNKPVVKAKIESLKKELKRRNLVVATKKEAEENKYTWSAKYIRGVNPKNNSVSVNMMRYKEKHGIVWAYWYITDNVIQSIKGRQLMSVVALVKNKNDKIQTIGFCIGVRVLKEKAKIAKSNESYIEFNIEEALGM